MTRPIRRQWTAPAELRRQARDDGYVACSECGHHIEQHESYACSQVEGCTCRVRFTAAEIIAIRVAYGLPPEWD